ncbi:MAG: ribosome recycling factor [Bacteroidota bacterium]
MEETIESTIVKGKEAFDKALEHLREELMKIRAGKASPAMLTGLVVPYYGSPTPLSQVANISTPDSRTLSIQPWEKSLLGDIEKSIFEANLGLTPMNDGEFVRITIPPLTEERRKDLVKQTKTLGEDAKIALRSSRQKMMDFVKKEVKDGYPEDEGKKRESDIDTMVKLYTSKIESYLETKEKEIMTV